MDNDDLRLRVTRVENDVTGLDGNLDLLKSAIGQLNVTVAILEQTLKTVKEGDGRRSDFNQKISFFFIGGFIAAVVGFIVKGGLSI